MHSLPVIDGPEIAPDRRLMSGRSQSKGIDLEDSLDMKKVSLFHLGPPKTATTWLYHCLREHPEICAPQGDTIHYFSMHFARGEEWYHERFTPKDGEHLLFDPTPSYICSPRAPERIAAYNPEARLIVCLRHPIDRAYSHYWHLKKNDLVRRPFRDALSHYECYATWVEHGFIGIGLERVLAEFDRDQLLVLDFMALNEHPEREFQRILDFAGISVEFVASALHKKVNVAGPKKGIFSRARAKLIRAVFGDDRINASTESRFMKWLSGKREYLDGIDNQTRVELLDLAEPEIQRIEELLGMDLRHWRR